MMSPRCRDTWRSLPGLTTSRLTLILCLTCMLTTNACGDESPPPEPPRTLDPSCNELIGSIIERSAPATEEPSLSTLPINSDLFLSCKELCGDGFCVDGLEPPDITGKYVMTRLEADPPSSEADSQSSSKTIELTDQSGVDITFKNPGFPDGKAKVLGSGNSFSVFSSYIWKVLYDDPLAGEDCRLYLRAVGGTGGPCLPGADRGVARVLSVTCRYSTESGPRTGSIDKFLWRCP